MAELPQKVSPGELIRAIQLNEFIDYLKFLEDRIAIIEAGGVSGTKLKIIGLSPSEDIRMGQELRVIGQGFGIPALNVVTIESTTINSFKAGSHNNALVFDIPPVSGVPAGGKEVTLTVSGPGGFDATKFDLDQALPNLPDGTLVVQYSEMPPEVILNDDANYVFIYAVRATVNMDETYDVVIGIDGAEPGWFATLINADGSTVPSGKVSIAVGSPPAITTVDIRVRAHIPVGGSTASLHVRVESERNGELAGEKRDLQLAVGSPPPAPSPISVFLSPGDVLAPGQVINGTLVIPPGSGLVLAPFQVLLKDPGAYVIEDLQIDGDPQGRWTAQIGLGDRNFTTTNPNDIVTIPVGITSSNNSPNATLVVSVSSQGSPAESDSARQPIARS